MSSLLNSTTSREGAVLDSSHEALSLLQSQHKTLFLARVSPVTAPNKTKQCDFRQVGSFGCYPIMGPGTLKSTNYTMGAVLEQQKIMNCAS
jgi:hypothetical protein